jgi:hypothetical protein
MQRYLRRYYEQAASNPNEGIRLFRLPLEVIGLISDHLPIESRVCFSLTCKTALQIVGNGCWRDYGIRGSSHLETRRKLLQYLSRDADLVFCEHCSILHPSALRPPASHRVTKYTKACLGQWGLIDYFPQVKSNYDDPAYYLIWPHIESVFANPSSLDRLVGSYSAETPKFAYTLASSAAWIEGNLTLQHMHRFSPPSGSTTVLLQDILDLELQICPHHSTTTRTPSRSVHTPNRTANGPILTYAVSVAWVPLTQRIAIPTYGNLRPPTPLEKKEIELAHSGEDVVWRCRGCATKFRVTLEDGNLLITSWHCFGKDLVHAAKYWKWLVRREAYNLGPEKRNNEFWYKRQTVPDFPIGHSLNR